MYNRYIRNDYGSYTRIPQQEAPPVHRVPSPPQEEPPSPPPPPPPPPPPKGEADREPKFLERMLEKLHLDDLNAADLLLLALLFFLFEEKADDELLIGLGLLLIL